jgi:hypothetical protein
LERTLRPFSPSCHSPQTIELFLGIDEYLIGGVLAGKSQYREINSKVNTLIRELEMATQAHNLETNPRYIELTLELISRYCFCTSRISGSVVFHDSRGKGENIALEVQKQYREINSKVNTLIRELEMATQAHNLETNPYF